VPGAAEMAAWPSRELRLRTVSAVVLAPLALAVVWIGGTPWVALLAVFAALLAVEWLGLTTRWPLATRFAGVPYIGCAIAALLFLRADPTVGRAATLFVVAVVWGSDIGAFLVGRAVGGPRLVPTISPGKTWSGAVGGVAVAIAAAALVVAARGDTPHVTSMAIAGLLALASQAGDLLESAIKRATGVKDSGRLIPGHGGAFDRLDGMLIAAPVAALLAWFAGEGEPLWNAWR